MITKLEEVINLAVSKKKKRLAVAYAADNHTIEAVYNAVNRDIVDATLIGDALLIKDIFKRYNFDINKVEIIDESSDVKCVSKAIEYINNGKADILMKGLVSTDKYMRGILSKDNGLLDNKSTLSHIAVLEMPSYHKLLIITDVAVIPAPDISQKIALTKYVISTAKSLGIETPKVALIAPSEQVLTKIESCTDAAIISKMADRGQITGAIVDGPLALDVAIDKESLDIKGINSPIEGDADCLVFPNIESANVFFKTATKLCNAQLAGFVVGARVPCVLTSRGDSSQSKLYSIALAALNAQ